MIQHPFLDIPFLLCKAFQKLASWLLCDWKILQEPTVVLRKDFAKQSESPLITAYRLLTASPVPPLEKELQLSTRGADLLLILPHLGRNGHEEGRGQDLEA